MGRPRSRGKSGLDPERRNRNRTLNVVTRWVEGWMITGDSEVSVADFGGTLGRLRDGLRIGRFARPMDSKPGLYRQPIEGLGACVKQEFQT